MKISALKVLTDENVSPLIVSYLRKMNIDVADVKEKGWQGTDDKYLMKVACTEERFIVTQILILALWLSMKAYHVMA